MFRTAVRRLLQLEEDIEVVAEVGRGDELVPTALATRLDVAVVDVSYDALHYQWARVCQAAGLVDETGAPRYTPHQLRHTRGSELIAQGQRVEIVQRVLGHRDIRSTLGYAELQDAQVRAALEGTAPR